jgi:ABC-type lipoprotein export system ATPase subunit
VLVSAPVVIDLAGVEKDYRGLRPLRIERLEVAAGEPIAIMGLDQVTAEVLIDLVTGAILPDRGEVKLFGRSTASIGDSAEWLALVDRFGIVSERAALLESLSVIQNLSLPFTVDIEPPPEAVRIRAAALAREVELPESTWTRPVSELAGAARARLRWARAIALDPAIIVLEHPTRNVPSDAVEPLAGQIRRLAERRGAAILAATVDEAFAGAVARRVLRLDPATGRLKEPRGWFRRL